MSDIIAHGERNRQAFALPMAELSAAEFRRFAFGNRGFNLRWAVAPASSTDVDGLGPTFVQPSCSSCHVRDGRGPIPNQDGPIEQAVVKLSPRSKSDRTWLQARYGDQLQTKAISGVVPEALVLLHWESVPSRQYSLRRPVVRPVQTRFRGLQDHAHLDLLVAPSVFGLGLLEAVPVAQILERADPDDRNQDGISGRAHWLDPQEQSLGRFGWKASVPSLRTQTLSAATGDIGLTHPEHPYENCPQKQRDCRRAAAGETPDLNLQTIDAIEHYLRLLAVPKPITRQQANAQAGRRIFFAIGCEDCHRESLNTEPSNHFSALSGQTITPYSDLLLHDLGDGLAGNHRPGSATGREWRTPPLWGLSLIHAVNDHQQLLHDGRARNPIEAILWHDGEAATSRKSFEALSEADQSALVAFLNSL